MYVNHTYSTLTYVYTYSIYIQKYVLVHMYTFTVHTFKHCTYICTYIGIYLHLHMYVHIDTAHKCVHPNILHSYYTHTVRTHVLYVRMHVYRHTFTLTVCIYVHIDTAHTYMCTSTYTAFILYAHTYVRM